ncbi:MAG: hypothetical protein ABI673_02040 [Novosphingobium sp.]
MNPLSALLAPLLLLPIAVAPAVLPPAASAGQKGAALAALPLADDEQPDPGSFDVSGEGPLAWLPRSFSPQAANQVRLEQHIVIRVTPAAPPDIPRPETRADVRRNFASDQLGRGGAIRLEERGMGKCIAMSGIAGLQISPQNRLILFMRDQRIISAALEKGCGARDFYSGFYVQRSADGKMCSGRETLQSRTGASCKLGKLRQLVEAGE